MVFMYHGIYMAYILYHDTKIYILCNVSLSPYIAFLQFCESIVTKFELLAHRPTDITSQTHYMAFIYLGFYLSSKYCPVWVYITIMSG